MRHALVSIDAHAWRAQIAARTALAGDALVAQWVDTGRPLVRRRATPAEGAGVPLGLPLPPSAGKRRLAFVVAPDDIVSTEPPPYVDRVRDAAPRAWQRTLDRVEALAEKRALDVRVFGSLAWSALTGLDYLTAGSDLDLLFCLSDNSRLDGLTADIAAIEAGSPMRMDGELVREDGLAANWREVHLGARTLLVKTTDRVHLLDTDLFLRGETT